MRRTVSVHCTPWTRCSESSRRRPSAVWMNEACTLPSIGTRGSRNGTLARIWLNSSRARRMSGEWLATLTVRRTALRAPTVLLISRAKASAGMTPESTIWPGALALATPISPCSRAWSTISCTCSSDRPMTAPMPPSMPRSCMIRPRSRTRSIAVSKSIASAATAAAYCPAECPATDLGASVTPAASASSRIASRYATLVARIAGWAFTVRSSSSPGPSAIRRESGKPSVASARSITAAAAGDRSRRAAPIPTYCEPWPGKTNACTRGWAD